MSELNEKSYKKNIVFELLSQGKTVEQIVKKTKIKETTVRSYLSRYNQEQVQKDPFKRIEKFHNDLTEAVEVVDYAIQNEQLMTTIDELIEGYRTVENALAEDLVRLSEISGKKAEKAKEEVKDKLADVKTEMKKIKELERMIRGIKSVVTGDSINVISETPDTRVVIDDLMQHHEKRTGKESTSIQNEIFERFF